MRGVRIPVSTDEAIISALRSVLAQVYPGLAEFPPLEAGAVFRYAADRYGVAEARVSDLACLSGMWSATRGQIERVAARSNHSLASPTEFEETFLQESLRK